MNARMQCFYATEKIIFNLPHQRSAERTSETQETIISFKFDIKNSLLIAISLELHCIALHLNGLPVEVG